MKNLPLPVFVPYGSKLTITQGYGATGDLAWYKEKGIAFPFHNGVDLIVEPNNDGMTTYGTACFCPFPKGWTVKKTFDSPMSTKGNGITLESDSFVEDGVQKKLQLIYWHFSKLVDETSHVHKDIVGYIGNSGAVKPEPTPLCPFNGSHLHFMLFEYFAVNGRWVLQNSDNGVGGAIDPMTRFTLDIVEYAKDTGISFDVEPIKWAFEKLNLTGVFEKMMFVLKVFRIK